MKRRPARGRTRFERACGKVRYPDDTAAKLALSSVKQRFARGEFLGGDEDSAASIEGMEQLPRWRRVWRGARVTAMTEPAEEPRTFAWCSGQHSALSRRRRPCPRTLNDDSDNATPSGVPDRRSSNRQDA